MGEALSLRESAGRIRDALSCSVVSAVTDGIWSFPELYRIPILPAALFERSSLYPIHLIL